MPVGGAFGAKVKIMVGAAMTAIAHLNDVDAITLRKVLVKATGHDAAGGFDEYYDSGNKAIPAIKLTLAWDKAHATHAALVTAFNSPTPVQFSVEDPASTEVIAFSAHVQELGRTYKQNGVYTCVVTIQPTGAPTITP